MGATILCFWFSSLPTPVKEIPHTRNIFVASSAHDVECSKKSYPALGSGAGARSDMVSWNKVWIWVSVHFGPRMIIEGLMRSHKNTLFSFHTAERAFDAHCNKILKSALM